MFGIRGLFLLGGVIGAAGFGVARRRRSRYALGIDADGFGVKEVEQRGLGYPWSAEPDDDAGISEPPPRFSEPEYR